MLRQAVCLLLRGAAVAVCVLACLSGHPPASAQAAQISAEDAVQDSDIIAINRHLEATDARVSALSAEIDTSNQSISEMEGEQRVFFAVLGLLTSGSIFIQFRGKKP